MRNIHDLNKNLNCLNIKVLCNIFRSEFLPLRILMWPVLSLTLIHMHLKFMHII